MDRRQFIHSSLLLAGASLIPSIPAFAADSTVKKIRDLYNKDLSFSSFATERENNIVEVSGYMAPPLKAEANFFVLTARPMSVCPFCETEAEWPDDILLVYTKRPVEVISFNSKIVTKGVLQLGTQTDPETGFVSKIRMANSIYARA